MADDDDWGITPDYKNEMTEKEQRFGAQALPGRIGHIDLDELRQDVVKSDAESKQNAVPKASYGYGGKFGVEKDRMDKSAVGTDYHAESSKHSSQQDYAKGFGGKYGVQTDRQDKNAVGYDHREELSKHSSQKDYSVGFGGKYGVQKDRVDSSAVGYKDATEPSALHQSQQRADVSGGQNRASELRQRFEKLALDMNKPAERPTRPDVGKIKLGIFAQQKPTEEPKLEPRPVKPLPKEVEQPKPQEIPKPEPVHPPSPKPEVDECNSTKFSVPEPAPVPDQSNATADKKDDDSLGPTGTPAAVSLVTAVANFDFEGSQSDELSFKAGETIVDIDKFDEAWWSGRIGSRTGIFPANHVQQLTGQDGTAVSAPAPKLQPTSCITAMALYDFAASQSDELSFKAGDEIVDIDKFDADWWSGRIGDRVGIFPANHVSEN